MRLGRGGHGVRGVHAGARPGRGTGGPLDLQELVVVDRPVVVRPDGLEHVLDRDVAVLVRARQDRAAVQVDRRQVQTRHRHQHGRLALVAAGDTHQSVEPLGVHHQLHRIGDHLAADQRRLHALVAHRDAVGDRDRRELDRDGAALPHAFLRERGELVQVVVAGRDLVPRRRHRDLRLAEILFGEPHRSQHGPGRSALGSFGDLPAAGAVVCHGVGLLSERVKGHTVPTDGNGGPRGESRPISCGRDDPRADPPRRRTQLVVARRARRRPGRAHPGAGSRHHRGCRGPRRRLHGHVDRVVPQGGGA